MELLSRLEKIIEKEFYKNHVFFSKTSLTRRKTIILFSLMMHLLLLVVLMEGRERQRERARERERERESERERERARESERERERARERERERESEREREALLEVALSPLSLPHRKKKYQIQAGLYRTFTDGTITSTCPVLTLGWFHSSSFLNVYNLEEFYFKIASQMCPKMKYH